MNQSCNQKASSFCDVGLYCIGVSCNKQKQIGEFCLRDFECVNNAFCYTVNQTCLPYLSLQSGQKSVSNSSIAFECSTLFSDNGYCQYPPFSLQDNSKTPCTSDNDCQLSNGLFSQCSCGYNANGNKYCETASGDPIYDELIAQLKVILLNNSECYSDLRFSSRCSNLSESGDLLDAMIDYALLTHLTYNNPPCVRETLTQYVAFYNLESIPAVLSYDEQQYKIKQSESKLDPVLIVLIVVAVLALASIVGIIVYVKYKGRKEKSEEKVSQNDLIPEQKPKSMSSRIVSVFGAQQVSSSRGKHSDKELDMREIKFHFEDPVFQGAPPEKELSGFIHLNETNLDISKIHKDTADNDAQEKPTIASFSLQQAVLGGDDLGTRKLTTYASVELGDKLSERSSKDIVESFRGHKDSERNEPQPEVQPKSRCRITSIYTQLISLFKIDSNVSRLINLGTYILEL